MAGASGSTLSMIRMLPPASPVRITAPPSTTATSPLPAKSTVAGTSPSTSANWFPDACTEPTTWPREEVLRSHLGQQRRRVRRRHRQLPQQPRRRADPHAHNGGRTIEHRRQRHLIDNGARGRHGEGEIRRAVSRRDDGLIGPVRRHRQQREDRRVRREPPGQGHHKSGERRAQALQQRSRGHRRALPGSASWTRTTRRWAVDSCTPTGRAGRSAPGAPQSAPARRAGVRPATAPAREARRPPPGRPSRPRPVQSAGQRGSIVDPPRPARPTAPTAPRGQAESG